ncbi:MAG: integrase arm-type DNA-binding domain-containing protein [Magnetococcus sp. YQC-5]
MGKLTALAVKNLPAGMHGDGAGLWLQVTATGARSWIFRYRFGPKNRYMGLGSVSAVSLANARKAATKAQQTIQAGIDPLEVKAVEEQAAKQELAALTTFQQCAEEYIDIHRVGWNNPKHAQQWTNTLLTYAIPIFGALPVGHVDARHVELCLRPIWRTKPETASRVRGRIEAVLDFGKVKGYRDGENPARWQGHMELILGARERVVRHHAALPYREVPDFMKLLRLQAGNGARCLEFTILTATRTGEAIGARWEEIDLQERTWSIPATRMKAKREHMVPLSESAVMLLERMSEIRLGEHVFPGQHEGKPISNMAMLMMLRRMGRGDLTTHGFRSAFRDWGAEQTEHQTEVLEMALAHAITSKVEAAYRRGSLFEKRRGLMNDWAQFVEGA